MHIKYHTKKGSVYIHTIEGSHEYWIKKDTDGRVHPVVEALHISVDKLQELLREYPSTLLDKTYCFEMGVEKEFFDDAKREVIDAFFESEETVILFLVKRHNEHYGLCCSSEVVEIEKSD